MCTTPSVGLRSPWPGLQVAISLAQTFGVDQATLTDIYKRYGDHLYGKGDFDGAISQYIKTIGSACPHHRLCSHAFQCVNAYVHACAFGSSASARCSAHIRADMDASYVIMKFLDAQRIHNLTKFLQALHEKREANPDHTTLLLSCYTKLKDVNQLDKFIAADWEFSAEVRTGVTRRVGASTKRPHRLPSVCAERVGTYARRRRLHVSTRSTRGCSRFSSRTLTTTLRCASSLPTPPHILPLLPRSGSRR